jgi:hypothetical protein
MSDLSMQSLFAAAREDAPDPSTHDAIWNDVANATGIAAGATVAAAATTAAKPAAATAAASTAAVAVGSKLLVMAILIGAVSAVAGGVVALGWMESQTGVAADSPATAPLARSTHLPARGAQLGDPTPRLRDPQNVDRPAPSASPAKVAATISPASSSSSASDLAEEARLVTEARTALVGGDPKRALSLLEKTHRLANRALEPEELSLEARALRALGRVDEAAATELKLKARFPSNALAR